MPGFRPGLLVRGFLALFRSIPVFRSGFLLVRFSCEALVSASSLLMCVFDCLIAVFMVFIMIFMIAFIIALAFFTIAFIFFIVSNLIPTSIDFILFLKPFVYPFLLHHSKIYLIYLIVYSFSFFTIRNLFHYYYLLMFEIFYRRII